MRPIIAVTSGEPAGIGPELCLRLADFPGDAQPVILGDRIADKMPVKLVHRIAAAIFAVLGVATLLGAGQSFGL